MRRIYDDLRLSTFGGGTSLCSGVRVRLRICSRGIYSNLCSPRRVAARATVPHSGAGRPSGLIADPRLRTCVYRGVCSDIRSTPGIYSSLCSPRRVADRDTIPRNGAGDPSALITDPCLHTAFIAVCAPIFGVAPVIVGIPAFTPICGALVELPFEPACIGAAVVVVMV